MTSISFDVLGPPMALKRPRTRIARPKSGKDFIQHYEDKPVTEWKVKCREECRREMDLRGITQPLQGALSIVILARFPCRKSRMRKTKPAPELRHDRKPDASNVLKIVEDALNGLAYIDDSQIAQVRVEKWECAQDLNRPIVIVSVFHCK